MKIVENGDPRKRRTEWPFGCEACGCAFSAEEHEYQLVHIGQAVFFRAVCPWCKSTVMQDAQDRRFSAGDFPAREATTPESAVRRNAVKR